MRHDFIFDVLEDLRAYAALNGLLATVATLDEALRVARAEVAMGREVPARAFARLPGVSKRAN